MWRKHVGLLAPAAMVGTTRSYGEIQGNGITSHWSVHESDWISSILNNEASIPLRLDDADLAESDEYDDSTDVVTAIMSIWWLWFLLTAGHRVTTDGVQAEFSGLQEPTFQESNVVFHWHDGGASVVHADAVFVSTDDQTVEVLTLGGDDTLVFGDQAAAYGGRVVIDASDGDDTIVFGRMAAMMSGEIAINTGHGDDRVEVGDSMGYGYGNFQSDLGVGDNELTFGDYIASQSSIVEISAGDGNDVISFGNYVAMDSSRILVTAGDGDNHVSFGSNAAIAGGHIQVVTGIGADIIEFGNGAAQRGGTISINAGLGADQIAFGVDATRDRGNIEIDLGSDNDVDVVTFEGTAASLSQSGDIVITGAGIGDQIVFDVAVTAQGLGSTTITLTTNNKVVQITGTAPMYGNVNGAGTMFAMTAGVP